MDFQRMQDNGHLLARARNVRRGLTLVAGMHLVVGCEDAQPADGSVELEVLPGPIEHRRSLLPTSA